MTTTNHADLNEIKRRMTGALDALKKELGGLRTGRASATLLDPVMVSAYDNQMPISQVGTVSVPEPRMITVQVWDKGLVKAVEKAIRDANLGLNPMSDGALVRVPLPQLSQERRDELSKIAHRYAEHARVSVRNVRRDGMDALKRMEKDKEISEDEHKKRNHDIQTATDDFIKKIDETLTAKDKEIKQI